MGKNRVVATVTVHQTEDGTYRGFVVRGLERKEMTGLSWGQAQLALADIRPTSASPKSPSALGGVSPFGGATLKALTEFSKGTLEYYGRISSNGAANRKPPVPPDDAGIDARSPRPGPADSGGNSKPTQPREVLVKIGDEPLHERGWVIGGRLFLLRLKCTGGNWVPVLELSV